MELIQSIFDLLHALKDWTVGWAYTPYATPALFLIAFAESSFFLIPPDVLLIPIALGAPHKALWFAAVATLASTLGGMLGYAIGHAGGRPLLRRFFNAEKVALVQDYYNRYDIWAVGIAGFTPIPYKLFSISAGAFQLDFKRFVLATIVGRGGRFFLVGLVVFAFGRQVSELIDQYFEAAVVAFSVLLVGGFWIVSVMGRRAARPRAKEQAT